MLRLVSVEAQRSFAESRAQAGAWDRGETRTSETEMKRVTVLNTPQSRCRAAVARCEITPPIGIYHRMWGAALHDRATGVHRPLEATAAVD